MTITPIVDHSPGAMTNRARVYLCAAGGRHFWIGMFLLVMPWLFTAAAFIPIFGLLPLWLWGLLMVLTGIVCNFAAIVRNADLARIGMVMSATITLVLAIGLTIGIVAIWSTWISAIGGDSALQIIQLRPVTIPAEIAQKAPSPASPFLPLIMLAVTIKDFAVCAQPLRVPLEEPVGAYRLKKA